jgi:hypothetical protein
MGIRGISGKPNELHVREGLNIAKSSREKIP